MQIWCSGISYGRTDADNQQRLEHTGMSCMTECVMHTNTRKDTHIKLANFAQELVHMTLSMTKLNCRKMCAGWVSKNRASQSLLYWTSCMHLTHANHITLDVEEAVISHRKDIQSSVISEEVRATILCKHKV